MRAHLLVLAICASAAACSGGSSRTLVLIHTNDEHSHIIGSAPETDDFPPSQTAGTGAIKGGASRRATVFAAERARATAMGAASLTVSAGDNLIGSLSHLTTLSASPDYRIMKLLGYDVTTLGNHEFDFGPANLATAIQLAVANEGMVPTVASNIRIPAKVASLAALFDESGKDATKPIHRTLVVTSSNGLRVGFLGIVGQDASAKAPAKTPVTFSLAACCDEGNRPAVMAQIFADLQPLVDSLRRDDKVDLVVLLSHAGVDLQNLPNGEDYQIAKNVKGIDVIVSGHTHSVFPATLVMNDATQRQVLIQQAGVYGQYVGRIQLTVDDKKNVSFDLTKSALLPVDDTIVGSDPRIDGFMGKVVTGLESVKVIPPSSPQLSFLEYTLSQAELQPVHDDPNVSGDLYFRTEGKTAFDIPGGIPYKESQGQILAADAELWAVETMTGKKADVAVFAQGALRGSLLKGKTGNLTFADIFSAVSIGGSPVNGTPGYPLCRFVLALAEIKGAFDLVTANLAQTSVSNSDYFLVPAGMKVEFDLSRPAFDTSKDALDPRNGRVTRISLASSHAGAVYEAYDQVIYDATHLDVSGHPDPFFGGTGAALHPYVVVANLYVATLSYVGGVKLKDPADGTVFATPAASIIHRADGSEIKDWEALAGYIHQQSAANGGTMPARYNPAVSTQARRSICSGTACPER